MTKLVDTLFGDKGKAAAKQQAKQNQQERQLSSIDFCALTM